MLFFKPLVSIIMPVYNTKSSYLSMAVESALLQSYKKIELIIVNDGSTEAETNDTLEHLSNKNARINYINLKENIGRSAARNLGIDIAKGHYIFFLDADDMIAPTAIEHLLMQVQVDRLVLPVGKIVYEKPSVLLDDIPKNEEFPKFSLVEGIDNIVDDYRQNFCCFLYNKNILNQLNLRFNPNIFSGEDRLFVQEYKLHISTVAILEEPIYFYRRHLESHGRNLFSKEQVKSQLLFLISLKYLYLRYNVKHLWITYVYRSLRYQIRNVNYVEQQYRDDYIRQLSNIIDIDGVVSSSQQSKGRFEAFHYDFKCVSVMQTRDLALIKKLAYENERV